MIIKRFLLSVMVLLVPGLSFGMERIATPETIATTEQKAIICDLGGIFFDVSYALPVAQRVGVGNFLSYMFWDWKAPWKIKNKVFAVLNTFPVTCEKDFKPTCDTSGKVIPLPICLFQAGRYTFAQIMAMKTEALNKLDTQKMDDGKPFFVSSVEREIIEKTIEGMFDPQLRSDNTYTYPKGIELLKELASLKNADGSKKYKIIALSNWDRESFPAVQKRFEKEFFYFDDVIISGNINTLKPNDQAFDVVLQKHRLTKENCIFLDDQKENIDAGNAYGIKSVIVEKQDFDSARLVLYGMGVLPNMPPRQSGFLTKKAFFISAAVVATAAGAYALFSKPDESKRGF